MTIPFSPEETVFAVMIGLLAVVAYALAVRHCAGPSPKMRRKPHNIDVRGVRPPFNEAAHTLRQTEHGEA